MVHILKNKNARFEILIICISLVLLTLFELNQNYFQLYYWMIKGDFFSTESFKYFMFPVYFALIYFIYKRSIIAWWIVLANSSFAILTLCWNYMKECQLPELNPNPNTLETLLNLIGEPRLGLFFYASNVLVYFVPLYFCLRFNAHFFNTQKP